MEIITGRTGEPHVYAADDAEIYRLFLGDGDFLLTTGNKLSASMYGTTKVRIADGSLIMQGRLAKIRPSDGYDELDLDIGTVGYKRVDLVVAEYNQTTVTEQKEIEGEIVDVVDKFDSVELKVVKGTPNANNYVEPAITTGNIDDGETHQVKLWAVRLNGINFDSLVDYRVILDTTPIQTALSYATASVAQIRSQMNSLQSEVSTFESTLSSDIYEYADDLREGIAQGFRGIWRKKVTVTDATVPIAVSVSNYTYSQSDSFDVFLEGLRLTEDEYTITYDNGIYVTLDATTFTGQLELVIQKISEEA